MTVTIDDYLPFYNGNLVMADKSVDGMNIWHPLIEKAFAKVMGNYEFINYGW